MSGLVVLREGDALPPLLLLHGFAGAPASWRAVAARLDPPRRAVAAALPGHDPTRRLAPPGGFLDAVRTLGDALDRELPRAGGGAGPWHLAGYSMGARVGLALLLERPALFGGATFVGLHPGLPDEDARRARRGEDRAWIELLRRSGTEAFAAAWEARPLFASQAAAPEAARAVQRAIRRAHDAGQLAAALEVLGLGAMPDLAPRLTSIGVPVTLVAGGADAKFLALARRVLPALAFGTLVAIEGAGHNPLLERPDALAAILSRAA
ncbi:MAG: alpha/beta fold hydrolase [Acidobacteria bacterium]|jgi:2-succinyl-6-hydroxy-2,4-cyclohexadiene-1-carboxylate synthase|nr:alpha/beta fold hydrolase [Acidobacteriota bacterium]